MELLKFLEGIRSPFLDTVIGLVTRLGEETVAIAVLCAIFWCISKKTAYGISITYLLSGLTVQGMKIIFRIDRPWIAHPELNPVHSALEHATGYSFPSGHTQSATSLLGSLGAAIKQVPLKIVFFFLVILVAFSRMYLGVHTLLDVTVSLLITSLIIFFTIKLFSGNK
ncbi:MAG: phosphatase PAP2 family protein, partial [Treponema sp.]|nr:phosphatase PAP2 family protein [Treponema sp.]